MIVFHADLDNTLIYSYKHDLGSEKTCVEIYQDRQISFMTDKSYALLKEVYGKVLFVPTTTRTIEQYRRIDLGIGIPRYALTCNGGVLLVDGKEDEAWYRESLQMVTDCQYELKRAKKCLEEDEYRNFEVRNIQDLFIFTKSAQPDQSVAMLQKILDLNLVDVFSNGVKVYVVPVKLNKGSALQRFRKKVNGASVIAAGDSEFDVSMLREADTGIAPEELVRKFKMGDQIIGVRKNEVFSEKVLEHIIHKGEEIYGIN